ncbi:MAG: hypothetical protein MUO82_06450 [Candidatus Thermoplasmatota archaeon]|nr:hypothetical protein [Candidatus Thermoplasmatota archaeon]
MVSSDVVNVEDFGRDRSHVSVITKRGKHSKLFYLIHAGVLKPDNTWRNQFLYISEDNVHILESLLRKSIIFSASIPLKSNCGSGFVLASDLLGKNNAISNTAGSV